MKKFGLWMLAAILLCGSMVTLVACNGNLDDFIGHIDNASNNTDAEDNTGTEDNTGGENNGALGGNNEELVNLLALIQNAETITITVNYASVPTDLTFKKENGSFVFQVPDGASMSDYNASTFKLKIENEKELIFGVYSLYVGYANAPYFGIIVDAENKKYSRVNYNANYDFVSIKIDGQSVDLTDACPNKTVVKGNNYDLFYVYYASGETWEDVAKRYTKAFGTYKAIVEGTGDNTVSLRWYNHPTTSASYGTYYLNRKDNVESVTVGYGDNVMTFDGGNDRYIIFE